MKPDKKPSALGGVFGGIGLEAFAPMVLLGIRRADLQELAVEAATVIRPFLKQPDDARKVATLLGLISANLAPAPLELVKPESEEKK
jgi:hypothetical protein